MISKKTIIILVIVIALLAGAYFAVDFAGRGDVDNASDKTDIMEELGSVMEDPIFEADKDSIISVAVKNNKDEFEFYYEDNMWKARGSEDVLYSQAMVTSFSYDYVSVTPILVVEENSDNASTFGLDTPVATSVVKTNTGKTAKFYLGDKTKGGNGYYFMMDGDDKIYTISMVFANNMLKTLDDFKDRSIVSVSENDIKEIKMSVVGVGDVVIKLLEQPIDAMTSWQMTKPYTIGVYDERLYENVITPMISVSASTFLTDIATETQLSESGLNNPSMYYEITTGSETIRVNIGKNFDGAFAVKRADKSTVYLVDSSALSFLYVDILDYVQSYAYLPNYDTVEKIVCNTESTKYSMSKSGDEYFVNDNKISEKKYTEYYQKLFDVKIQGIITAPASNPDDVIFSYTVNKTDGSSDKISFINVNSKFAYMSVNDELNFYVYNEAVVNASNALKELYEYSENPVVEDEQNEDVPAGFNWLALVVAAFVIVLIAAFPVSMLANSKKKK